jgi:hypothetical protein
MRAGWDYQQLSWFRKAEKYHLMLTQMRWQEAQRSGQGQRPEGLDALFPRVRFVGPSGAYEPGIIASESWGELPADALLLIEQLLWWLPMDNRLYWLLAELLNACGEVVEAADVLKDLVEVRQYTMSPELRQHYLILQAARPIAEAITSSRTQIPGFDVLLLWAVAPRESTGALGLGPLVQQAGWTAALKQAQDPTGLGGPPEADSAKPLSDSPNQLPSWQPMVVCFVAGVLVTLLLGFQLRQSRRLRPETWKDKNPLTPLSGGHQPPESRFTSGA